MSDMKQLDLFRDAGIVLDDVRVCVINDEAYASILDAYRHEGSNNPRRDWKRDKAELQAQGYDVSKLVRHNFKDNRNGQGTPVASLEQFARIAQVAKFRKWESLRQRMATLLANEIKSMASYRREQKIKQLDSAGLGDRPETIRLKARHENIQSVNSMKTMFGELVENPVYGLLFNAEYLAVLGYVAKQLEDILDTNDIRGSLPTMQLRTLTLAEDILKQAMAGEGIMTNEQMAARIMAAMKPVGKMLREVCDSLNIHVVTGRPLLPVNQYLREDAP